MKPEILISIVIPVKNGDYWLERMLTAITQQTLFPQTEIIIVDSGSTDNSINIIKKFPVELIRIPPSEFNHGETRNIGVRAAKGKYVVLTVQDATATDKYWLENLLAGFDDSNVAGVCGQQIVPHEKNTNPVQWFRPQSVAEKKKYYFPKPEAFERLSPVEKKKICGWDDVNAMYRKEVLLSIPFKPIVFGEDCQWAKDAILQGHAIVYNNDAKVYHYHYETPAYTFKRVFTECYLRYSLLQYTYAKESMLPSSLRDCKILLKERKVGFLQKLKWAVYNFRIRYAANAAIGKFNKAVLKGDDYLKELHRRITYIIPVSSKPIE